jgi:hypothetical protein
VQEARASSAGSGTRCRWQTSRLGYKVLLPEAGIEYQATSSRLRLQTGHCKRCACHAHVAGCSSNESGRCPNGSGSARHGQWGCVYDGRTIVTCLYCPAAAGTAGIALQAAEWGCTRACRAVAACTQGQGAISHRQAAGRDRNQEAAAVERGSMGVARRPGSTAIEAMMHWST